MMRFINWLHLWLGLISGIVVFIVSITGCIYVFEKDIRDMMEPWRFVEPQNKNYVPPSELLETASAYMPGHTPTGLTYASKEGAAAVGYGYEENGKRNFTAVFLNPYTGGFLKKRKIIGDGGFDFFRFVIAGHRWLWLPPEIGKPIVGISTLIFVVLLLTGLVMWWPKNFKKSNLKKSFKIKWHAKFRRLNYDLHNVLGFYSLLLALIIALTGLVISFQWVENGVYYIASGGEEKLGHHHPHSVVPDYVPKEHSFVSALDEAWYRVMAKEDDVQGMYMSPRAMDKDDPVEIVVYHDTDSYYDRSVYYFDQYSLERMETPQDNFSEAGFADQLSMLNYDIHIGAALGMPGKILAFFISLISASLPVTGFLYWWKKKKPKKSKV